MRYKLIGFRGKLKPWSSDLVKRIKESNRKVGECRGRRHPNSTYTGVRVNGRKIMDCNDCGERYYRP